MPGTPYEQAFGVITQVVNADDPEGLIGMGCPPDEYDTKVADLTALVLANDTFTTSDVVDVWDRWFGREH